MSNYIHVGTPPVQAFMPKSVEVMRSKAIPQVKCKYLLEMESPSDTLLCEVTKQIPFIAFEPHEEEGLLIEHLLMKFAHVYAMQEGTVEAVQKISELKSGNFKLYYTKHRGERVTAHLNLPSAGNMQAPDDAIDVSDAQDKQLLDLWQQIRECLYPAFVENAFYELEQAEIEAF